MNIKLHALGGYEEVGRNMTCLEIGDEAVILDMGVYMDRFVPLQDQIQQCSTKNLIEEDVIPDDRPINHLRKKMKIPHEKFYIALREFGNTVSATIPIALRCAIDEKVLIAGKRVLMVGFGVGYSWGATLVRWN